MMEEVTEKVSIPFPLRKVVRDFARRDVEPNYCDC